MTHRRRLNADLKDGFSLTVSALALISLFPMEISLAQKLCNPFLVLFIEKRLIDQVLPDAQHFQCGVLVRSQRLGRTPAVLDGASAWLNLRSLLLSLTPLGRPI
jgi:hypothetical protein